MNKQMKLKILVVAFLVLECTVTSSVIHAQRRTAQKKRPDAKLISQEQLDFLERFMLATDDIDLAYSTDRKAFVYKSVRQGYGEWVELPPPLNRAAASVESAYDDWIFVYGRVTNEGAVNSIIRLNAQRGEPDRLTPSVFAKYGLALQDGYRAINYLQTLTQTRNAEFRDLAIQYRLRKSSPSTVSKAASKSSSGTEKSEPSMRLTKDATSSATELVPANNPNRTLATQWLDQKSTFDFEKLTGIWRVSFLSETGVNTTLALRVVRVENEYFAGLAQTAATTFVPVEPSESGPRIRFYFSGSDQVLQQILLSDISLGQDFLEGKISFKTTGANFTNKFSAIRTP